MQKFVLTEELKKMPEIDLVSEIKAKVQANEDLRTAMFAGCQIETFLTDHKDGSKTLTVRTKNPISILKTPDGKPIHVYEKRPDISNGDNFSVV